MTKREPLDTRPDGTLTELSVHDADPAHVERIHARCLTELARRRRRAETHRHVVALWRSRLEVALAAGLSALYLAAVVERTLEILR